MTSPVNSYFASQMMAAMGVRVPHQKVMSATVDFEGFRQMMLGVDWATRNHPAHRRMAKMALNRPHILIQEYIPGLSAGTMTKQRCQDFFAEDANNLINLGKIIAMDLALNNPDRFPITQIWLNGKGNPDNFLFMVDSKAA